MKATCVGALPFPGRRILRRIRPLLYHLIEKCTSMPFHIINIFVRMLQAQAEKMGIVTGTECQFGKQ